jgi:hypothetical protein
VYIRSAPAAEATIRLIVVIDCADQRFSSLDRRNTRRRARGDGRDGRARPAA